MYIFEVVIFFFTKWLSNQLNFSVIVHIYKIPVFDEAFFSLNYQNAYDHYTFQGGDMLPRALTHIYAWHLNGVVLWGHVTNKIHKMY